MDADWIIATLHDALAELDTVATDIEADPDSAEETLNERMPAVFAKLNYAWNTRYDGPAALETRPHDELVGWPKDIDFSGDAAVDAD